MDVVNNMHIHITSDYEEAQTKIRFGIIKKFLLENDIIYDVYHFTMFYKERGILNRSYFKKEKNKYVFENC